MLQLRKCYINIIVTWVFVFGRLEVNILPILLGLKLFTPSATAQGSTALSIHWLYSCGLPPSSVPSFEDAKDIVSEDRGPLKECTVTRSGR